MKIKNILPVLTLVLFTSCSVFMAANKSGTSIDKVQNCSSRGQYISAGGEVISSEKQSNGNLIEIYRFKKEKGSAARAFMHGTMDVMTLGIWEAIGTPIEACLDEQGFYAIKAEYDSNGKVISAQLQ